MNDKELIDILFARIEGWIVNAYFEDESEKLIDAVYRIEALVAELKTVLDAKIEALTAEIEKLRKALEEAPIIGLRESGEAFKSRQDNWLKTKVFPALGEQP